MSVRPYRDIQRRQRQVMWRGLGGNWQPIGFGGSDQLDSRARAHMLDVKARASDVAQGIQCVGHRGGLRVRRVSHILSLGMDENRQARCGGRLQGGAKHNAVHRVPAIIGQRHCGFGLGRNGSA